MMDMIDQLANAVREIVQAIEASPARTKDHYEEYMAAITRVTDRLSKIERSNALFLAVGLAMIKAGASREGVTQALKAMGKF